MVPLLQEVLMAPRWERLLL
jgi:hypothetical protein